MRDLLNSLIFGKREGFAQIIRFHSETKPSKTAVICEGRSLTYGELFKRAENLASFFISHGVKPGTKIAIMLKNCLELPEIWNAFSLARISTVPAGWRLKRDELKYLLQDSEADGIIYSEDLRDVVGKIDLPLKFRIVIGKAEGGEIEYNAIISQRHEQLKLDTDQEPEIIIYTSGTTGKPKGAKRKISLPSILMVNSAIYEFKLRGSDIHLATCPLYHSAPLFFSELTLLLGATLVILPKFRVENFLRVIEEQKVTTTFIVPFMIVDLLNLPDDVIKKYDLSSLRTVICAAAPLSPELKRKFLKRFGPKLYEFYGATETGINTILKPEDMERKAESVGKPAPFNKIKILDENKKEVPPNMEGEIYVSSPFLMEGYYRKNKETKEAMAGRFLSVGDIGKLDEENYLYILDRKSDMVISGGVNIYPAEIEHVLLEHPAVKMAAIVGVPDKRWGERLKGFVVLKENQEVTGEELEKFLRERIADYKVPREWVFVRELPITPSGKILKRELKKM